MAKKFSLKAKFDTEGGISLKQPSSDATPTKKPLLSKAATAVAMELDSNPPPKVGFLSGLKSVVGLGGVPAAAATATQEKKVATAVAEEEDDEEDNKKKQQDDIETETDERDPESSSSSSMDTKGDDNKDTAAKVAEKLVAPPAAAEEAKVDEKPKKEKKKKKKAVSVKVKTKDKAKAKGGKGLGKAGPKRHETDKNGKKSNVEAALSRTVIKRLHYRSHKIDKDGKIVLIKRSMGIYNDIRKRLKEYLTPIIRDMCTYVEHARMKTACEEHAHQALKRHGKPLWGSMEGGDTTSRKSKKSTKEGGESKKKKAKVVSAEEAVKALSAAPAPMEVVSPSASE
jgi:hypothetical protein